MPIISGGKGGGAPTGSAGGDLGGTYPNPTVTGGTHLTAASVPIASLADPTTGKVIGSASNAAAAVFPPGYELNYTQVTGTVNVASTTEATGTTILSPGAITFDGGPVVVTFNCYAAYHGTTSANQVVVCLFESSTEITRLSYSQSATGASGTYIPIHAQYRFTPSAASHTYTITAFTGSTTGTPALFAGSGSTGNPPPMFVRFQKV